jgi:hypothetical protein
MPIAQGITTARFAYSVQLLELGLGHAQVHGTPPRKSVLCRSSKTWVKKARGPKQKTSPGRRLRNGWTIHGRPTSAAIGGAFSPTALLDLPSLSTGLIVCTRSCKMVGNNPAGATPTPLSLSKSRSSALSPPVRAHILLQDSIIRS